MKCFLYAAILFVTTTFSVGNCQAELVLFNLRGSTDNGGLFDFDASTGSVTDDATGLTLNFSNSFGEFNSNGTTSSGNGLGINAQTSGGVSGANDTTDQLDGGSDRGNESFTVAISGAPTITNVRLTQIGIGSLGDDTGQLAIFGVITPSSISSGTTTLIPSHANLLGSSFDVAYTGISDGGSGNGFTVTSLAFEIIAVPEPTTFGMFAIALGLFSRRRRV